MKEHPHIRLVYDQQPTLFEDAGNDTADERQVEHPLVLVTHEKARAILRDEAKRLLLEAYRLGEESNDVSRRKTTRADLAAEARVAARQADELIAQLLNHKPSDDDLPIVLKRIELREEALREQREAIANRGRAATKIVEVENAAQPYTDAKMRAANDDSNS